MSQNYLEMMPSELVSTPIIIICNDKDQATPLHFAILANSYENTRLLLKYQANPNAKDSVSIKVWIKFVDGQYSNALCSSF